MEPFVVKNDSIPIDEGGFEEGVTFPFSHVVKDSNSRRVFDCYSVGLVFTRGYSEWTVVKERGVKKLLQTKRAPRRSVTHVSPKVTGYTFETEKGKATRAKLMELLTPYDGKVMPPTRYIGRKMGISGTTVQRNLKRLVDSEVISLNEERILRVL